MKAKSTEIVTTDGLKLRSIGDGKWEEITETVACPVCFKEGKILPFLGTYRYTCGECGFSTRSSVSKENVFETIRLTKELMGYRFGLKSTDKVNFLKLLKVVCDDIYSVGYFRW